MRNLLVRFLRGMEKRKAVRQILSFSMIFIYPLIWFPIIMVNREFTRLLGTYTTCYLESFFCIFIRGT